MALVADHFLKFKLISFSWAFIKNYGRPAQQMNKKIFFSFLLSLCYGLITSVTIIPSSLMIFFSQFTPQ